MDNRTVADIRAFNRHYTRWVGALENRHLGSRFSLAEARVLYEIAHSPGIFARDIMDRLGLDAGYLSRMLKRFESDGLIERQKSEGDGRAAAVRLTATGLETFAQLDRKAAETVQGALTGLSEQEADRLIAAMGVVTRLTNKSNHTSTANLLLREPRPGDVGWAIERHGIVYEAEFGWGTRFEGLVAELFGRFASKSHPEGERCWIAELNGRRVGCVFVVEREPGVAQLRCLLVEPTARGHGVGRKLVNSCIEFARAVGYERMMLWTNKGLESARQIYEAAGFTLIEEKPHEDFGLPLIGQSWELAL